MSSARGYAIVCSHGVIGVKTVSETDIGAMVNGLICLGRIMVTNDWTDERIRSEWAVYAEKNKLDVRPVEITTVVQ